MDSAWPLSRVVGYRTEKMLEKTHRTDNNLKCIVDLNDVTFIDEKGERLLRTMSKEGVQFVARGIYMKHLLQEMCGR